MELEHINLWKKLEMLSLFLERQQKNPGMRISSESEEITVKQQEDPYITDMRSVVILLKTMYKDEWLLYSCNNTRIQ